VTTRSRALIRRDASNPILTVDDLPHTEGAVFNPGAVIHDGRTLLLVRIEDRRGSSHLAVASSADGIGDWHLDGPVMAPDPAAPEEAFGLEDARVTYVEALGAYAIAYTAFSNNGPLVSLATTRDFVTFDRLGAVLPPENKDAALFPMLVDGRYAMLHRPVSHLPLFRANIWIAYSEDLLHWGGHRLVMSAEAGELWDSHRIGLATPPLLTEAGWLILYHAMREVAGAKLYHVGVALLDRDDPSRVVKRASEWILGPEEDYERIGPSSGVVFPCGWTQSGDDLHVYYGAADQSVALAHTSVSALLRWLDRHSTIQ
jgi:predicted GH43/DUF377 family glycosyl hydrolase